MTAIAHQKSTQLLQLSRDVCQEQNFEAMNRTLLVGLATLLAAKEAVLYSLNVTAEYFVPLAKTFSAGVCNLGVGDQDSVGRALLVSQAYLANSHTNNPSLATLGQVVFPRLSFPLVLVPFFSKGFQPGYCAALFNKAAQANAEAWCSTEELHYFAASIAEHTKLFRDKKNLIAEHQLLGKSHNIHRKKRDQAEEFLPKAMAGKIVGTSAQAEKIRTEALRCARSTLPVLITGETGTGKDLLARQIHLMSAQNIGQFVVENLAAVPEATFERDFFGDGANKAEDAAPAEEAVIGGAGGGTLYLDEIGDAPAGIQARLLGVLQEGEGNLLGTNRPNSGGFRLITATHQDLASLIDKALFRRDLHYRIRQLHIHLPPLRERGDDVIELANHFLRETASLAGTKCKHLTREACELLLSYEFPGNVRELQGVVARALLAVGDRLKIDADALAQSLRLEPTEPQRSNDIAVSASFSPMRFSESYSEAREQFEYAFLRHYHQQFDGNRRKMAERLKLPKRTLADKLQKYQLDEDHHVSR